MSAIFDAAEDGIARAASVVQHSAAWLVGMVAQSQKSLSDLEASSPLVTQAIVAGTAAAVAHGVPVGEIETVAADVLALAKTIAGGAPAPAPATAIASPPPSS